MRNARLFVRADRLLDEAAKAARQAAKACRAWERGGSSEPVGDTADIALTTAVEVFALAVEHGEPIELYDVPETRRARLALAGYLLLLAGTDEHGESDDLAAAAVIFRRAAIA